jgi:hypothetical protein
MGLDGVKEWTTYCRKKLTCERQQLLHLTAAKDWAVWSNGSIMHMRRVRGFHRELELCPIVSRQASCPDPDLAVSHLTRVLHS